MAATTYFATEEQLRQRASVAGILAASDDDADGVENSTETADAVTEVRNYSRTWIQAHLQSAGIPQPMTQDDSSLNPFLAAIAVDIEFHRLATRRGHVATESQQQAYDQAMRALKEVASRKLRVPSLTYPGDGMIDRRAALGRPMAANPRRGR